MVWSSLSGEWSEGGRARERDKGRDIRIYKGNDEGPGGRKDGRRYTLNSREIPSTTEFPFREILYSNFRGL
jgi:hypothetical protein